MKRIAGDPRQQVGVPSDTEEDSKEILRGGLLLKGRNEIPGDDNGDL